MKKPKKKTSAVLPEGCWLILNEPNTYQSFCSYLQTTPAMPGCPPTPVLPPSIERKCGILFKLCSALHTQESRNMLFCFLLCQSSKQICSPPSRSGNRNRVKQWATYNTYIFVRKIGLVLFLLRFQVKDLLICSKNEISTFSLPR